jgi:hypothetical protein
MAWHPWLGRAKSAAVTARLDVARADLSTSHAAAITSALAEHDQTDRTPLSYEDALALVCKATGWPVGHVWLRGDAGWRSGAWHDSGPEYADLKAATVVTDMGAGRGIVAAVLYLEACRFLPGIEGLGSTVRERHAAALGLTAIVGVPVRGSGRVQGVFEFVTRADVEPGGALADALLTIADRARRGSGLVVAPTPRRLPPAVEPPLGLAG